ncbi:unnamed protein product [Soboliphyme baturini]|uniref:One cut domain family member n=1 Tax=Soboliphyme baturini TaxID=241478 RepID=A0A183IPW5_9BILA|nr:unnamed protein product [Soboliphyme baturini]
MSLNPPMSSCNTVDLAQNLITTMFHQSMSPPATNTSAAGNEVSSSNNSNSIRLKDSGTDSEADDIYIDTKELCNRIAYELKTYNIPQAVFAERILCRSQGTLSDLLRNPKPWNKLKSGRETFRRMYNWLRLPLEKRLNCLELGRLQKRKSKGVMGSDSDTKVTPLSILISCPCILSMQENVLTSSMHSDGNQTLAERLSENAVLTNESKPNTSLPLRSVKKTRLVFTDIQKRTLKAIFKETQRPSREVQQTIAQQLALDLSTVQNFFMNARRRSRLFQTVSDSPGPNQQVRPITPPPSTGSQESVTQQDSNGSIVYYPTLRQRRLRAQNRFRGGNGEGGDGSIMPKEEDDQLESMSSSSPPIPSTTATSFGLNAMTTAAEEAATASNSGIPRNSEFHRHHQMVKEYSAAMNDAHELHSLTNSA